MGIDDLTLLDIGLRKSFPLFVERCFVQLHQGKELQPNWHHSAVEHAVAQILSGETNRLIINIQPRSLKSLIVSVAFPAFVLGHEPARKIYVISYGADLADQHSRDFRAIVESDWYKRAFPKMRITRSLESEVVTTARGFRRATTVMGALTGLGGDLFILDDPQKAVDAESEARRRSLIQWFGNTLVSRLDDKRTGAIVIVMQRVHMNDLCGYLTEASKEWKVLRISAIADADERVQIGAEEFYNRKAGEPLHPDRESISDLMDLQKIMPPDTFAAQYQQDPVPEGGVMILREWLRYYEPNELPERSHRSKVFLSVDTAAKDGAHNDWSVCTAWLLHDGIYYLLDLVRGRLQYTQLRDMVIRQASIHRPSIVLIEDAHIGIALAQELKKILRMAVKPVPVARDKRGRMYVQQEKFYGGAVRFPKGASFLPELERELLAFPNGPHDDQVDSISQALAHKLGGYTLDNL